MIKIIECAIYIVGSLGILILLSLLGFKFVNILGVHWQRWRNTFTLVYYIDDFARWLQERKDKRERND